MFHVAEPLGQLLQLVSFFFFPAQHKFKKFNFQSWDSLQLQLQVRDEQLGLCQLLLVGGSGPLLSWPSCLGLLGLPSLPSALSSSSSCLLFSLARRRTPVIP